MNAAGQNITRRLAALHAAAPRRRPGYVEECLRRGRIDSTGRFITFTQRDYEEIRRRFNPAAAHLLNPGCCG